MKLLRNKSTRPIQVSLPRGKVLHLGPGRCGSIADRDADCPGVLQAVESGDVEISGEGAVAQGGAEHGSVHASTHGHHPPTQVQRRGDR
jgi:hypothetical protein